MLKFEDLVIGKQYKNKKHGTIYTLKKIGLFTESENEVLAYYEDEDGYPWFRPLGLFMIKFENIINNNEKLSAYYNLVMNHMIKKFGYTPPEVHRIFVKYEDVLDELDVESEDLADSLMFAEKSNLTLREWQAHIDMVRETLKEQE